MHKKYTFDEMKKFQNELFAQAEAEAVKKYGKDKSGTVIQSRSNFKTLLSWCLLNEIEPFEIVPIKKGPEIGWVIYYEDVVGKRGSKEFYGAKAKK